MVRSPEPGSDSNIPSITVDSVCPRPTSPPITGGLKLALSPDELDAQITRQIETEEAFPPELPVKETIGKLALTQPHGYALHHPAAPLLTKYALEG